MIIASGWASGVNLYAVVALLGLYGRLGLGEVPDGLQRTEVIVIAGILYAGEFVFDKIPYVDNLWDAVHTVVRPLGAAAVGAVLAADAGGLGQAGASIGSGLLALTSHSAKATTRAAVNTSPEPFSNIGISLAEDGIVAAVVYLAVTHPWVALGVTVVLMAIGGALTVMSFRAARTLVHRFRERRAARQ